MDTDLAYMTLALEEAQAAADRGEVPVGAVLVESATGTLVARDGNRTLELSDPSAHAELLVIRAACAAAGAQRVPGLTLYVTLEPCTLCAAAITYARLDRVVFAAPDPKGGAVVNGVRFFESPTCHHRPLVAQGPLATKSGELLRGFFRARRG